MSNSRLHERDFIPLGKRKGDFIAVSAGSETESARRVLSVIASETKQSRGACMPPLEIPSLRSQ